MQVWFLPIISHHAQNLHVSWSTMIMSTQYDVLSSLADWLVSCTSKVPKGPIHSHFVHSISILQSIWYRFDQCAYFLYRLLMTKMWRIGHWTSYGIRWNSLSNNRYKNWETEKFYFSLVFYHEMLKWPCLSTYLKPSVYSCNCWLRCVKMSKYGIFYSTLQYIFKDTSKGKVIAGFVRTIYNSCSFHINNILPILNVLLM